jgi:hypothetical protein
MRVCTLSTLMLLLAAASPIASAQQGNSTTSEIGTDPQAAAMLQKSLAVLAGTAGPITDVTMAGTVNVTSGTISQFGTVTLAATSGGKSRVTFGFASGGWATTSDYTSNPRVSTTTSATDTTNSPVEDLLGPHPAWFYPAFLIAAALTPNYVSSNYSQQVYNGAQANHASIYPQSPTPLFRSISAGWMPLTLPRPEENLYFGQQDLYVDPSSLYPIALVFRLKAQASQTSSGATTRPVYLREQVSYLNYENVEGRPVATHVRVNLGSAVVFDIQISSVAFNTGVVIAAN